MAHPMTTMERELLESLWIEHVKRCPQGATFDRAHTATLANTCLKGAGIIKDLLNHEALARGPRRLREKKQREQLAL